MELTLPEIIQVLRRRTGMNQGEFGVRAFGISRASARTRVKNIELGRCSPDLADLEKMAAVLGIPVARLASPRQAAPAAGAGKGSVRVAPEALAFFPGLGPYLEMLNKAVRIGDRELVGHIAERVSALLARPATPRALNR